MAALASSSIRASHAEGFMLRRPHHASSSSTCQIPFTASSSIAPLLPLVDCPDCGEQIHRYVSRSKRNRNRVYYKCANHTERDAPCDFWYWEVYYHRYLDEHDLLNGDVKREKNQGR